MGSGAAGAKPKRYNVIMVGNSSVGKTSFMKWVENGRFNPNLTNSVGESSSNFADGSRHRTEECTIFPFAGLDTSMWPVNVDGKQVVLQLWDTAGQERQVSPESPRCYREGERKPGDDHNRKREK